MTAILEMVPQEQRLPRDRLIYCSNAPRWRHKSKINADRLTDNTAIADIEPLFVCTQCGAIGAELRPDFSRHTGLAKYAYGTQWLDLNG
jgi:hypothetical protein